MTCPFCRYAVRKNDANEVMKRVQANDPIALCEMGIDQRKKGKYMEAFEYYSKAAELGMRLRIIIYQTCIRRGKVL